MLPHPRLTPPQRRASHALPTVTEARCPTSTPALPAATGRPAGREANYYFPRNAGHEVGEMTPSQGVNITGVAGDQINDTMELVENAVDGFPVFWDGIRSGSA